MLYVNTDIVQHMTSHLADASVMAVAVWLKIISTSIFVGHIVPPVECRVAFHFRLPAHWHVGDRASDGAETRINLA